MSASRCSLSTLSFFQPIDRAALLGADSEKYKPFVELISNDVKQRWPMAKGVLSDYFDAVAIGLEGAK